MSEREITFQAAMALVAKISRALKLGNYRYVTVDGQPLETVNEVVQAIVGGTIKTDKRGVLRARRIY